MPGPDQTIPDLPTLADHLSEQAALAFADPRDRLVADHLIGAVDGCGWLAEPAEAIGERLGCPPARLERVLATCRAFDPPGVFARNLADCLALQLAERDRLDPAMRRMLDHLDLVARRDVAALSRLCGVDAEDVIDMVAEIRRLDPKPGAHFAVETAPTRIPEVIVRSAPPDPEQPDAPQGWVVDLNDAALPRLLIDRRYRAEIAAGAPAGSAARVYLRRCLDDARWLIRALDRRATTLLAVSTAIVQRQDAFLRRGIGHLRPMVLREVATDTGLHESTVSRVVSGKTIETPRGLFAMKSLFTQGLAAASAGAVVTSAEAVRHRIRSLIEGEDDAAPLSDDRIAALLKDEGIAIARRTVAKYREAMGIPGSGQRRLDAVMMPARLARA
jgi:RNA polymerase sigma-54 factor